ncbi:GvpL/GvpF family gas vesicle protein [Georgenia sp. Z1491]|uniref:GvpL/GvpF family gas vesicle protein n=1 Tax=Georgenia sp. Z1491 TaxID=3416707 RepID=UPI003CF8A7BD
MSTPSVMVTDRYLYGVVLSGGDLRAELVGVQGRPVRTVRSGRVAALVGDLEAADVLGTPDDLLAHTNVLDAVATTDPVLPLAFGTVVPDDVSIENDVLAPREREYAEALESLTGYAQYSLRVMFDRDTVLREIVTHDREAGDLQAVIAGTTEDQTRPQRIRLGEIVVRSFESLRPAEAAPVLDRLAEVAADVSEREAGQADAVLEAAVLVAYDEAPTFEAAVEDLAAANHERLRFRLVGPQAPYDFVSGR